MRANQLTESSSGPLDSRTMRCLVDLIEACGAAAGDVETELGWIEEDLRALVM